MATPHQTSLPLSRRQLLAIPLALAASGIAKEAYGAKRKKVAVILTAWFRIPFASHAEVIVRRILEGYWYNGEYRTPGVQVVSMFTDQVPENDVSREMAQKHGYTIFPSIREALTLGGNDLAVDGVILIGEHGDYPMNEKGQRQYPRYELYKQVIDVFRETGRAVPVFTDKHLSYSWEKAKWMYDQSRELKFPLMAGSNLPLWWRDPEFEFDLGTPIENAIAVYQGEWATARDDYGFHGMEILQCMVERRKGGETGISAVQCLEGQSVWNWTDANPWARDLLDHSAERKGEKTGEEFRAQVRNPIVYILEYTDGLRAAVYRLNRTKVDWSFAAHVRGNNTPVFVQFRSQRGEMAAPHFTGLVYYAEQMIIHNRAHYPVERTLLTTGALATMFDSSWQEGRIVPEGKCLETPHLHIAYRAQKKSLFNRFKEPPVEEKRG